MKDEYDLFTLSSKFTKPLTITVEVEGESKLDTGASLSVISYETYQCHLSHKPLKDSKISIKTYLGEPLQKPNYH